MTIKVYREGKEVEIHKESISTENNEIEDINTILNEAEEETKQYEEELKAQLELERMKVEEPERYKQLKTQNKKDKIKGMLFLTWFSITIILILLFASMNKPVLMFSVFGHYFSIFGIMAIINEEKPIKIKESIVPIIFVLFGLIFMVGCILYQFEIIRF